MTFNPLIRKELYNMSNVKMATNKQTWALFCITKKDYRHEKLTYDQASEMIEKLNAEKGYVVKVPGRKEKINKAEQIHNMAVLAGTSALEACNPVPMIVEQHANMLNDNSPVVKSYYVEGGVCGFASIYFKASTRENRNFLAGLKQAGLASDKNDTPWQKNTGGAGYYYWVSDGGQSLQRKEAFAHAFVTVLKENGIIAYVNFRMD